MTCSYDGCERPNRSKNSEWCEGHYYQLRRGTPLRPLEERRYGPRPCAVEGCGVVLSKGSYCSKHAKRIRVHGDPHKVIPPNERALPKGEDHHKWTGDEATYSAVHQRLQKQQPASELTCSCGRQAHQWSYIGPRNPDERLPFSSDLSQYVARCVPCHKKADLDSIREVEVVPPTSEFSGTTNGN